MGLRTTKIAIAASVLLLCIVLSVFWYFKVTSDNGKEEFNLYQLVPPTAQTIIETENAVQFVYKLNELQSSKDGHFLQISHLFSYLKDHFNTLIDDIPHGLSLQMNRMLVSFHAPNDNKDQVFYFCLGKGDYELVESFIQKYSSSRFPAKTFKYKEEEIRIYSMADDNFLACYVTPDFLAISYQKKLVEEVIDAYKSKKSIIANKAFSNIQSKKDLNSSAKIYMRPNSTSDTWTELDMTMNNHAIYLSGINHKVDNYFTFMDTIRQDVFAQGFPEGVLPASTYLFTRRTAGEFKNVLNFFPQETPVTTSFFHTGDSLSVPHVVVVIPVSNTIQAVNGIQNLTAYNPEKLQVTFEKLTGIKGTVPYHRFYRDLLILGSDFITLGTYIQILQKQEILSGKDLAYSESIASLSDSYSFMAIADIDKLFAQSDKYGKLLPDFFYRHKYFFNHFMISMQFTHTENNMINSNIVLIYEEN